MAAVCVGAVRLHDRDDLDAIRSFVLEGDPEFDCANSPVPDQRVACSCDNRTAVAAVLDRSGRSGTWYGGELADASCKWQSTSSHFLPVRPRLGIPCRDRGAKYRTVPDVCRTSYLRADRE